MNSSAKPSTSTETGKGYFFHGNFLPERAFIHLNYRNCGARLADKQVQFSVFSYGSHFNGQITSDIAFENVNVVAGVVTLLLKSILDRLGYLNLCGYDVDVVGAVSIDGAQHQVFGVSEPVFFDDVDQQFQYAKEKIPFCDELINLRFHDVRLDHALRCFSHAMRDDALTPLFCYIAIECLARKVIELGEGGSLEEIRGADWIKFRSLLNIKESTIKDDVKSLADDFRHGKFVDTSWGSRKKALAVTWEIVRRTMFYIRTSNELSKAEFPEL